MLADNLYLVTAHPSDSPYVESYRILRTNIFAGAASVKSALVTSARGGEGKTTVAANLAITSARGGRRVALVDGDLRQPMLHELLGVSVSPGLAEVASGQVPLHEALVETEIDDLLFLPAGRPPEDPPETLGSSMAEAALAKLNEQSDVLVMDAPALLAYTDPIVLSAHVDGVVVVFRAGQVPRESSLTARSMLENGGARILGVVLVSVRPEHCDSLYHHYESFVR